MHRIEALVEQLPPDMVQQVEDADAYMLTLVSFDSDFDHTQRGRKTPAQIV
ncbi:MAG TPA: hypothetical protein PKZ84_02340 [Anaerolineae bacterium]|nr:hypothetical protein [Anaerolineae bacterium]HQI83583.1 hypothetical protein [Anaerolineae bacterium]